MAITQKHRGLKAKSLSDVRTSVPVDEVQKENLVRVNLNVPTSQRTRWKMAAIARNIPLGELIAEAVETHLNK